MNNQLEQRLRQMGFNPARGNKPEEISKTLRRACNGAFGSLNDIEKEKRGQF